MKNINQVYSGDCAARYDATRIGSERWRREALVIEPLLRSIDRRSTVLDIAAGTGRWLDIYAELEASAILLDASDDMLAQARAKAVRLGLSVDTILESATADTDFPSADCAVVTNFFNWISIGDVTKILGKVKGASVGRAIFMITYLPTELELDRAEAARAIIAQKNLEVREGRRRKGIYHLHDEADVRRRVKEIGALTAKEHMIVEKEGRRNVVFDARFAGR